MPHAQFRIAHVSDLHLAESPGENGIHQQTLLWRLVCAYIPALIFSNYRPWAVSYCPDRLRALTRSLLGKSYFNELPYDGYIFSGDLATTGMTPDMAVAAAYLNGRPMHQVSAKHLLLALPSARTVLVPGNHDRYYGAKLKPESVEFERGSHFGGSWRIKETKDASVRSFVNHSILHKNGAKLGVVCGDFSYTPENAPAFFGSYIGGGCVEDSTVNEMIRRTLLLQSGGVPCIWVAHHAPIPTGFNPFLRLKDARKLGDGALETGIRTILCGHTHVASKIEYAIKSRKGTDRTRVICAGSATEYGKGHRSYFELLFNVASEVEEPKVRLAEHRTFDAKNLQMREERKLFARGWEFKPRDKQPARF